MKSFFLIALLVGTMPALLYAQRSNYRVVFDLTSKDSLDERAVIRWLNEVAVPNPNGRFEVVMYGKGFNLVMKNNLSFADDVNKLSAHMNIAFKVCAVAMKSNNVQKSDLLPCVQVVPDGIYEIVSKQHEGWGYIKAVH